MRQATQLIPWPPPPTSNIYAGSGWWGHALLRHYHPYLPNWIQLGQQLNLVVTPQTMGARQGDVQTRHLGIFPPSDVMPVHAWAQKWRSAFWWLLKKAAAINDVIYEEEKKKKKGDKGSRLSGPDNGHSSNSTDSKLRYLFNMVLSRVTGTSLLHHYHWFKRRKGDTRTEECLSLLRDVPELRLCKSRGKQVSVQSVRLRAVYHHFWHQFWFPCF